MNIWPQKLIFWKITWCMTMCITLNSFHSRTAAQRDLMEIRSSRDIIIYISIARFWFNYSSSRSSLYMTDGILHQNVMWLRINNCLASSYDLCYICISIEAHMEDGRCTFAHQWKMKERCKWRCMLKTHIKPTAWKYTFRQKPTTF